MPSPKAQSLQAEAIRNRDWSTHPLGPYKGWPQELKTTLSLLLNSHFPMFLAWGPERYFFYNDAYIPVLGAQKHARGLGSRFEELWSDIWSDLEPIVKKVDQGEASYFTDLPLLMIRNGKPEQTYFTFSYSPIYDSSGEVAGLFCACVETTEIILAKQRLLESAEEIRRSAKEAEVYAENLKSFFMQSPLPMVILEGREHRFTLANPPYERFAGQKVTGKTIADVFPEDQLVVFRPLLDGVYDTGIPLIGREMPLNFPNEHGVMENHFVDIGYHPFRDAKGSIIGVLAIVQDMTAHVQARKEIEASRNEAEAARSQAEHANQLKSAFLANMSHEIRTPLGAMMGFADLLRDRGLNESERSNYSDILVRNGEQLSVIINDILDLSKVEAGHLTLEYTDVDPSNVINEVISLMQMKAKEKGLSLEAIVDKSIPASIVSDPTRIRQVLLNLVSNAIKFTHAGSVTLKAHANLEAGERPLLCFEIIDSGIGIATSQHEKIFEVFVQADGSMTRRFGGTGLGLALSRSLARALGGEVKVLESKEREGSRFLFQVEDRPEMRDNSVLAPAIAPEIELTENVLVGKKVLVVDDAPDNQHLIRRYLVARGATVESAENGLVGFKKALSGDHDIVLMDIQMPEMDGYTATQKLREAGFRKPIIALTAHAMDEVKRKCLNIGCTDHLTKPIVAKALIETVARYTSI